MKPLFLLVRLIQQEYLIKFFVVKKVTTDTDLLIKVTDTNQRKKPNRSVKRAVLLFNLPRICSEQEKRLVYGII
nr:MAG TPA: hypothetical protein [Caudoviricetes sp.]